MPDFFISFTQPDRSWAEWIAWTLEQAGYTTILQPWDFVGGTNFVLQMDQATRAGRTIAVLSEAYLKAAMPAPEWAAAFALDPTGVHRRLVPVRVELCEPEGLLHQVVYIDLCGLSEIEATGRLVTEIETRVKPAAPPPFPGP